MESKEGICLEKKIYTIENLDCAHCAAKVEAQIRKLPQVHDATVVFTAMQLHLTAEDPDAILPIVLQQARTVEPDIAFFSGESVHGCRKDGHGCGEQEHHHDCDCDHGHTHHHDHDEEYTHSHDHKDGGERELVWLIGGGAAFVVGVLLEHFLPGWYVSVMLGVLWLMLGWPVLRQAAKNLIRGHVLDENFLMSIATIGALILGMYAEAVGVMLFYRIGEYFEHRAVAQSRKQIRDALDLRPQTVQRIEEDAVISVAPETVMVGDLVQLRPGDRVPLDGVVVSGQSRVDTSPITGEPVPVHVQPGDAVISGCINTTGRLVVRVEKTLDESMVSRILRAVEEAAAGKPKIDRFITRFSTIYTPVVVGLAAVVAIVPGLLGGDWQYWVRTALTFLVMSCPCALVLSVPLAYFSGIGAAGRKGILFKGGASMEALASIRAVALDKTGTLTKGVFTVVEVDGPGELLSLCAAAESASTHPIAVSIVDAARERGMEIPRPDSVEEIPGNGVRAVLEGKTILCGSENLLHRFGVAVPAVPGDGVQVFVAVDGQFAGILRLDDVLKADSHKAVQRLTAMGVQTAMLTGDTEENARRIANQVGIRHVFARLLPEDKLTALQSLRRETGSVLFVGDGINDAPVLSGADVGAAMGSGADAAMEAADVVFLHSAMEAVPDALRIARDTRAIAWQNVVFALAIKLAVMVLGLLGFASMWAAVFADSGVAMLCVLNSIRILGRKY